MASPLPLSSRQGSPTRTARGELKQYYLCSAWKFTDQAVDHFIAKLRGQNIQDADFSWEPQYGWVKTISPASKEAEIRKFWRELVTDVELNAYERAEEDIIEYNFTLKRGFKDEMIEYPSGLSSSTNDDVDVDTDTDTDAASSNGPDENGLHNIYPPQFSNQFPSLGRWTRLEDENLLITAQQVLSEDDRLEIQQDTGVEISYDLGKVVYLGAESQRAIKKAKERLDVLLDSFFLLNAGPGVQFVPYTEGYKDHLLKEFKSDIRFLANIDPKLPSSTLLDPMLFPDLSREYACMYHVGSSIRLCPYSSVLGTHTSLFGPAILDRKSNNGRLKPRPVSAAKSELILNDISAASGDGTSVKRNVVDPTKNVDNWLDSIPEDFGSIPQDPLPLRLSTTRTLELEPTISWDMPALVPTRNTIVVPDDIPPSINDTATGRGKDEPLTFDQAKRQKSIQQVLETIPRLLRGGPYLRGEVIVTVQFGRVIIPELAPSALAFNGKNTKSNGWMRKDLIPTLLKIPRGIPGKESLVANNICFTKILSTHGSDLQKLINIQDERSSQRLWQKLPSKCWTVYSFHCQVTGKVPDQFLVEITDCANGPGTFSYKIQGLTEPGSSQKLVYVHGLERKSDDKVNLSFSVDPQFKTTITSVRVLSKWRHLSQDKQTALDITEVEQLEIQYKPTLPGMPKSAGEARMWTDKTRKMKLDNGEVSRWYEASVSSLKLDEILKKNKPLRAGEKAEWSLSELKQDGIHESLCCPALQMLKHMDQVGGLSNNYQQGKPGTIVKRPNDRPRAVPGSEPA
ncbi:hypothetical protein B0T20DRAFT_454094 [Sordaria brevicollis]|uniref:Uncharacterized protein n=1 Tax=Sordaria brevicollis TaxID=83679 RepID=A0AAE0PDQ1_SORBR|nr:hypothetical protein B0T20DRAFT_454094 [Sordaria brevicollis]